jgi:hypothetical protein
MSKNDVALAVFLTDVHRMNRQNVHVGIKVYLGIPDCILTFSLNHDGYVTSIELVFQQVGRFNHYIDIHLGSLNDFPEISGVSAIRPERD